MNKVFNTKRFGRLLFKEIWLNKLNLLIMLCSLVIISLIIAYLMPRDYLPKIYISAQPFLYSAIALVYSMVIISNSFSELNLPDKKIEYLMLPASVFEKLLVKFLYTSIGFILIYYSAFSLSILIVQIYLKLFPDSDFWAPLYRPYLFGIYNISDILRVVLVFMAVHSVCFFGAVYFRKMEFAKIFFSVIGVFVFISLFMFVLNYLPFFKEAVVNYFPFFSKIGTAENISLSWESMGKLNGYLHNAAETTYSIIQYVLPPIFWILSYIRLKEAEVTDGV